MDQIWQIIMLLILLEFVKTIKKITVLGQGNGYFSKE